MRTLRLSLAGTVMLALLAPSQALAQEGDPALTTGQPAAGPVAWVTGTEHCATADPGSGIVDDAGVRRFRDGLFVCTMETSDPRVNGKKTTTPWQADVWGDPQDFELVQWMDTRIENDQGTWEGRLTGVASIPEPGDIIMGWYRGTGDYAGLSYFEQISGTGPWTIQGLIFPGEPPALVPPVE